MRSATSNPWGKPTGLESWTESGKAPQKIRCITGKKKKDGGFSVKKWVTRGGRPKGDRLPWEKKKGQPKGGKRIRLRRRLFGEVLNPLLA